MPGAPRPRADRAGRAAPLSLPAKLWLAAEVSVAYGRVRWALGRHELPRVVAGLRGEPALAASQARVDPDRLGAVAIGVLSVLPTDSRCLVRSLVLLALLARRDVASTLVIGVKTEPEFAAHAWIECEGRAVLPSGEGEFEPLIRL